MKAVLLAAVLLGISPTLQQPQDAAANATTLELQRNDGETVTGTLVGVADGKVKLRVPVLGGTMQVTHDLADYDTKSLFRIELAANPPKDFEGHFAMAKRAAELGLRDRAGGQARAAVAAAKTAPDVKEKTAKVRAWAADALEKMVRDQVAAGNLKEARHALQLLTARLPEQRTEEQLDAIAALVEDLDGRRQQDAAAKRQQKLDEKQRAAIDQKLKPITADFEKGTKNYKEAVRKSGSTVASAKLCASAIDNYKKAYKALEALVEKNPDDAQLAAVATSLGRQMHDNAIRAALHAANMRCIQGDYKDAIDWTQKVLAFDPENEQAKQMMQTIAIAQADDGDWVWGWRIVDDRPLPVRD